MPETPQPGERAYTIEQAAKYFSRTGACMRMWCINGTLLAANCRVEKQKSGRWIIFIPESS